MPTMTIKKETLFKLVNQETIYLSDPIGSQEKNITNRLADIIPLTEDDKSYFDIKILEVGVRILEKIAIYTKDIEYPYTVTDSLDQNYPDSIVYVFELPEGAHVGVIIPLLQQYITETLVKYIVSDWLKTKKFDFSIKELEFNNSLNKIKSAFLFGMKAVTKFRTL